MDFFSSEGKKERKEEVEEARSGVIFLMNHDDDLGVCMFDADLCWVLCVSVIF